MLRLEKAFEIPDVEGRGRKVAFLLPGTPIRIVLAQHDANQGEEFSEFRTGMDHLALTVGDRADLEAWSAWLDSEDVPHSPVIEGKTGWLVVFRDPDNIQIELYTQSK